MKSAYNGKIFDVHAHYSVETSAISEDSEKIGFQVENKNIPDHINLMDELGITMQLLSCPTQKYLDEEEKCAAYIRQVNRAGAQAVKEWPGRFLFAGSLPLPFVDRALAELDYVYDELGAKAIGLCSNYAGLYLGDRLLRPLYQKMNARRAVVILHPAAPPVYPKGPVTGTVLPMFEFIADTTRTVLDLFASGFPEEFPNIRVVIPHYGSCLPSALDRYCGVMAAQGKKTALPMEQLYFDLACDAFPHGVPILLNITDPSRILYGTDFPAIPVPVLKRHLDNALVCPALQGSLDAVLWNNASELFGTACG